METLINAFTNVTNEITSATDGIGPIIGQHDPLPLILIGALVLAWFFIQKIAK